jgi:hypothetical protein
MLGLGFTEGLAVAKFCTALETSMGVAASNPSTAEVLFPLLE